MTLKRTLEQTLLQASKSFPVILVTGPRQVGKTTLLKSCKGSPKNYVSLDDIGIRDLAKTDPAMFLEFYPPPIIIDEVQYAPELFVYIKILVDKNRQPGMFWLTGSQQFHLMQNVTESLAGRVAILNLLGFSQKELESRSFIAKEFMPTNIWLEETLKEKPTYKDAPTIYKTIWQGSYPQIVLDKNASWDVFYQSYVQTYIERDVSELIQVVNKIDFFKFLQAVAARTGQLLKYSEIAKDTSIDQKTAKKWLSVLEASGLVYLLYPYHRNVTTRLIKTPKLYFLDTGLCSFLTRWSSPDSLAAGAMSGAILETYIFSEILKSYWHNGKQAFLYYYRDKDQKEIDLIIEQNQILYPTEFKRTSRPSKADIKSFSLLKSLDYKIGQGAVICLCNDTLPITKDIFSIPVSYL